MFWRSFTSKQSSRVPQAGFGLIELMVAISIMVIVSAIILVRQESFNSAVLLRSQAYEIALQLREIQLSAVSASGDSGSFRTRYGAYFSESTGANDSYGIYRDTNNDGQFSGSEVFGKQGQIDSRFEVRDVEADGGETSLSIIFVRPNFDALFFDSSGTALSAETVEIYVARKGATGNSCSEVRVIEVTRTGQIAVRDCS